MSDLTDDQRPLDDYGRRQADALVGILADRSISRVLSSEALRCQQTIAPLAAALHLDVEVVPVLFEGSSTSRVLELIRSLGDANVVLCSHGDIIPDTIRALEVGGTLIHGDRRCAKGSVWELATGDGLIDTATYIDAPQP